MEKSDGRAIFHLLQQGEVIDRHVEEYLKTVMADEVDIYNLPGVRFKRVDDGTFDFVIQAHHLEVLARFCHVLKKEPAQTRVLGRFVLYRIEQYLRVGTSSDPIGMVEIDGEGTILIDGRFVPPSEDGGHGIHRKAALRNFLVDILQRSLGY